METLEIVQLPNVTIFGLIGSDSYKTNCAGGIIGISIYNVFVNNCYNDNAVIGYDSVAGIVGWGVQTNIRYCYNKGKIKSDIDSGGIIASIAPFNKEDYTNNYIYYCYNTGTVTGTTDFGSINGSLDYCDVNYTYSLTGTTSNRK